MTMAVTTEQTSPKSNPIQMQMLAMTRTVGNEAQMSTSATPQRGRAPKTTPVPRPTAGPLRRRQP